MERINTFGGAVFRRKDNESKEVKRKKKTASLFSSVLEAKQSDVQETVPFDADFETMPLETMLDEIHEQGERLKENPTVEAVRQYKHAVKNFVKFIVDNSMEVEEKVSGVNILKRKRFTLVKIIDEKLERLAAEILKTQRDQLEILKKIDEIHGLLVDLMG